ncbi:tRNA(Ile)-lysidine synthetase [Geofilum rubicundum JCM 15548]|uniref:tRNA(Ile)-lysidine synthase n=2 Tax=Geofilum TaxID=1236988 RepID=A0A0E9LR53_9BACT|nr:tRNA(Ile)-lysidine synthetase [Geofilum rubicundum JCM 15548]
MTDRCGVPTGERILVGISGGADSVALLHLLLQNGFPCVAAHCNFSLRGEESDEDERFVKDLCHRWKVEWHTIKFDTRAHSKAHKLSIEMAARELRYQWFEQLLDQTDTKFLATGHHGSDAIETFFLNLVRGTGIKGLTGISWRNKHIIRPLLAASAGEVLDYCQSNELVFRTDSSNLETHYQRNKIRHQIVPLLEELNPSFFETMQNNMTHLREAGQVFASEIQRVKEEMVAETENALLIPIRLISEHPQKYTMLYEILRPYGFPGQITGSIIESLNGIPGKQFFSATHRLVIDRFNLILVPQDLAEAETYTIEGGQAAIDHPLQITLRTFEKPGDYRFSKDLWKAHLDADLIDFPLTIRKMQPGDKFQPLGMQQFKKISDFFCRPKNVAYR